MARCLAAPRCRSCLFASALLVACADDGGQTNETNPSETSTSPTTLPTTTTTNSGDGDGDPTTTTTTNSGDGDGDPTTTNPGDGDGDGTKFDLAQTGDLAGPACFECSADLHQVLNCGGQVIEDCPPDQACDSSTWTCAPACQAMVNNKSSIGCEYLATEMDNSSGTTTCFAAYVANTWNETLHISLEYDGAALDVEAFTRIPLGFGPNLTLADYDADVGLAPGDVAVVVLNGPPPNGGGVPCPIVPAIAQDARIDGTGRGSSFIIGTDRPAVAYQINPYGAGIGAAVAGASLLIPTSAWDTNYIGADAYHYDLAGRAPSMNIVAFEDDTTVTINPIVAVVGGGGLPAANVNELVEFSLDRGEHAQFSQPEELTGSVIDSSHPIGLMAGHSGLRVPVGTPYADHAEQMIPPVRALGHEYVGVMHRPRGNEGAVWRLVGAVDGTTLSWSVDVGGPATLDQGEVAEFITPEAFVVSSQDAEHPYMLHTYMSGSGWEPIGVSGHGDSDFVISVPPEQYLSSYVFYTDPSYPETNLVVIRARVYGMFWPVDLDCYGPLDDWQAVGDDYEWTRIDLMTGNYEEVNNCSTGVHQIDSDAPFGLWVWGWGTPATDVFTQNRSYGYPGGMNLRPINDLVLDPQG